jgi:capsular polysaccharide biosynthesis protein
MPHATSGNRSPFAMRDDLPADPFLATPPQQGLVVAAISRNVLLVLLLGLLLAGAGAALGFKRKPTWTATSTLQIGANLNPNSPGYAGFVQSETSIATTFSRAVTANDVLARIHARTGLSPAQSAERVTATPLPDGAAIEVIATGPVQSESVRLANVAAAALVAHEAPNNFVNSATGVYDQYRAQAKVLATARARVDQVRKSIANQAGNASLTPNASTQIPAALVQAESAEATAQVRADALSGAYTQAVEAQPSSTNLLSPLASAVDASSDRTHKIELLGFVGLAAGFLIGAAIAILREQRRRAGAVASR